MKTKSMVLSAAAVGLALGALSPSFGAQPAVISEHTISTDAALRMATAALEKCRADGYTVSITVLNRHARPTVVLADDGSVPVSLRPFQVLTLRLRTAR